MKTKQKKVVHLRQTSEPEPYHIKILNALDIPLKALKRVIKIS
ncbi:hypothetical protein JCM13304A_24980 [Desulfothermus okinawensis JCM 13304]